LNTIQVGNPTKKKYIGNNTILQKK
jgi:hypothetical protein